MPVIVAGTSKRGGYAAAAITVFLWGSSYAIIRVALQSFAPTQLAALSFLVASVLFGAYGLFTGIRLPERSDLWQFLLAGGIGISLYNVLLNMGEVTVSAGVASFLINCGPVFAALLGRFLLGERLRVWGWVAILISLSGVALIASTSGAKLHVGSGALFIVAAAACAATQFYLQKPLLKKYSPAVVTAYMVWAGTLVLSPVLPSTFVAMAQATPKGIASAIYVGVFPAAVAYAAWSFVLANFPLGRAAGFLYLIPPFAMVFSFFWLHEVPSVQSLIGGGLALTGVILLDQLGRVTSDPAPGVEATGTQLS